mgnify:CR=1 FL=1
MEAKKQFKWFTIFEYEKNRIICEKCTSQVGDLLSNWLGNVLF